MENIKRGGSILLKLMEVTNIKWVSQKSKLANQSHGMTMQIKQATQGGKETIPLALTHGADIQ